MKSTKNFISSFFLFLLLLPVSTFAADRYWVSPASMDWHLAANWSATSGGAGGAGVPTSSDDVYLDGNGFTLCWANTPIVCNDFTIEVSATAETALFDQGGVIGGDFYQHDGYFGPTGGGGYTMEFQGNWFSDGGTFAVGTGTGVDPTCEFSGTGKTYDLAQLGAATYQNVLVSGSYTFDGIRSVVMNVSQEFDVSGTLTIDSGNEVEITNGPFELSGTIDGLGRLTYIYGDNDQMPPDADGGTIEVKYMHFELDPSDSGTLATDLATDGWSSVNEDWSHTGSEPWLETNDGDTSYISLPADTASQTLYDEHYTQADLPSEYTSVTTTNVKIHFMAKLVAGTGGTATVVSVRGYLWDGTTWQDGGTATIGGTTYTDRVCSTDLSGSIDTLAKVNGMLLKVEVDTVIGGGADKGDVAITQAWVEIDGTEYHDPVVELNHRTYTYPCDVEVEYTADNQHFVFLNGGRHYFNGYLTIYGDVAAIDNAYFDMATNDAEIWVGYDFDIDKDAFPSADVHLDLGNGTHVFRRTIDFYFSYTEGAATELIVDPAEGTIILYPRGLRLIVLPEAPSIKRWFTNLFFPSKAEAQLTPILIKNVQYRLSRVHSGGDDYQTYYKVVLFNEYPTIGSAKFVEGFACHEFIMEGYRSNWQFRKQTSTPIELYEMDRLKVMGDERDDPQIRSWLAITVVPAGFDITDPFGFGDVFNATFRDIDASHGIDLPAYNSTTAGTNTDIEFWDRDVRSLGRQRNMLQDRAIITPTPAPEPYTAPILETF